MPTPARTLIWLRATNSSPRRPRPPKALPAPAANDTIGTWPWLMAAGTSATISRLIAIGRCTFASLERDAALYIDSPVNCDQVGVGDSPFCLGSARPFVSRGVAHHRRSSEARTVDRGPSPHLARSGRDESALPGSPDE